MRLDLNPPNDSKGSLNVKIPIKIMKSEEVKAGLQSIWQDTMGSESASEDLQKKLALSSSFLQQETKRALQQVRAIETKLRKAIAEVQRLLQVGPGCNWSRAKLEEQPNNMEEKCTSNLERKTPLHYDYSTLKWASMTTPSNWQSIMHMHRTNQYP